MIKCDKYYSRIETIALSDFERGVIFGRTGKNVETIEEEIGHCYGTKNCDRCDCGGDKNLCTFYAEVVNEAKLDSAEDR